MLLYKISVWKFTFLLRAAPDLFRLQGELCQFLFFLSGKICCYKKLQSGKSRFYWEPHLVYSDCRGNSVNFYFLCLGKTCCYKKIRSGNSRFYWERSLIYSDCRGNYDNCLLFWYTKCVSIAKVNWLVVASVLSNYMNPKKNPLRSIKEIGIYKP